MRSGGSRHFEAAKVRPGCLAGAMIRRIEPDFRRDCDGRRAERSEASTARRAARRRQERGPEGPERSSGPIRRPLFCPSGRPPLPPPQQAHHPGGRVEPSRKGSETSSRLPPDHSRKERKREACFGKVEPTGGGVRLLGWREGAVQRTARALPAISTVPMCSPLIGEERRRSAYVPAREAAGPRPGAGLPPRFASRRLEASRLGA